MNPEQLLAAATTSSSQSCQPCMAVFFMLGVFGGYIATTILNSTSRPTSIKDDEGSGSSAGETSASGSGQTTKAEIDDEGNVIVTRVKCASNKERALPQSKPSDVPIKCVSNHISTPSSSSASEHGAVKLVIQRFRTASLLLGPNDTVQLDAGDMCGMLVYVSFSKTAETNKSAVFSAAKTVLNLSVLTRGVWGDGSGTASVLDLATDLDQSNKGSTKEGVPIVLVPQANLVSKVKNCGKSIQYHGQVAKALGEILFDTFVRSVELIALEQQYLSRKQEVSSMLKNAIVDVGGTPSDSSSNKGSSGGSNQGAVDPSMPPQQMFRDASLYESWDDAGFPLTKVGGEPLTKSATKKMKKQYTAQQKRHDKFLASGGGSKTSSGNVNKAPPADMTTEEDIALKLDPRYVRVVAGTFGNLQALSFNSDMGPFCHLVNVGKSTSSL